MNPAIYFLSAANVSKTYVPTPITIGEQIWDQKNLDTSYYSDGTLIPNNIITWQNTTLGAWRYYGDSLANGAIYGKLYNYHAVIGASGSGTKSLAPDGWRVATSADWVALEAYSQTTPTTMLTGTRKLRETGTTYWASGNNGTNTSLFSARGGGFINYLGTSNFILTYGYWRTQDASNVRRMAFNSDLTTTPASATNINNAGFSVRLIKNEITPAGFTTNTVTNKTTTQLTSGGSFGSGFIYTNFTEKGVVYGTNPKPTYTSDQHIPSLPNNLANYSIDIGGLTTGTLYHIRAYIISDGVKYYAEGVQATTGTGNPTVSTTAATGITYTTATSGGNITDDGGSAILERGVCWSSSITSPTIINSPYTSDGDGTGTFTSNITGLTPGTTYYYRAYARNSITTSYGTAGIYFQTVAQTISLTTVSVGTNYTNITATSGGTITEVNETTVTDKGICWSTSPNPTILNFSKSAGAVYEINVPFSLTADGLYPGVTYYIKAYATNTSTYYGGEVNVTTSIPNVSITTATPSSVNAISLYCGATAITNPDGYVIQVGYCWGTTNPPTKGFDNFVNNPTATAPFTIANGTTLSPDTTYYVRAYIIIESQSNYITYGETTSAKTLVATPTFTTNAVINYTPTAITSGGNITVTNGVLVADRGICWSTTNPPTKGLSNFTSEGAGTLPLPDSFTSITTQSPLTYNTDYYVSAYVINAYGTYYATPILQRTATPGISIVTGPVVSFDAVSVVCGATSYANTTPSYSIDDVGYCWSTSPNPTKVAGSFISNGTVVAPFTKDSGINLLPNTAYYIKAYATNNATGYTAYGDATTPFITLTGAPTITTAAVTSFTATAITSGGSITNTKGALVTERGICWSTSPNPTIADSYVSAGTGSGSFIATTTGILTYDQIYFIRAYSKNAYTPGIYYGDEVSQKTATPQNYITTGTVSFYDALNVTCSATSITSDDSYPITETGYCWGPTTTPVRTATPKNYVKNPTATTFTSLASGALLSPSTQYFIRAYALNDVTGYVAYGLATPAFITLTATPTFTTTPVTAFNALSISSGGNVTVTNGVPIQSRGIRIVLYPTDPATSGTSFASTAPSGDASFPTIATGLAYGQRYNIRAYITNAYGTYYSNLIDQTTYTPVISIATVTDTNPFPLSMICGGNNIANDNTYPITEKGYCYSSSVNPPTIANTKVLASPQTGIASFTANSGNVLAVSTSYNIRAYALNSTTGFVAYGSPVIVSTPADNASSSVTSFTSVSYTTATVNYNVVASTYYTIGTQGVCWSTSPNPTTSSSKTVITGGSGGNFSANLTGLTAGVTYNVRAYVTNAAGTLYSTQSSFATTALPIAYAFSLRKIVEAYTGDAILVRRSSDNLTQAIGFTGTDLNEAALLAWVGSGDGFVVTWYDQSGNNKHITNATNARQPRIVLAGVVHKYGNRAAIRFVAGNLHTLTRADTTIALNNMSNYSVVAPITTGSTQNIFGLNATTRFYLPVMAGGVYYIGWGTQATAINMGATSTSIALFSSLTVPAGGITAWKNNAVTGSTSVLINNGNSTTISVGAIAGLNYYNGYVSEIRGYTGPSDKDAISTNINDYYTIW